MFLSLFFVRLVVRLSTSRVKVKSTVPNEECWWGAQLPYLGLEPVGG